MRDVGTRKSGAIYCDGLIISEIVSNECISNSSIFQQKSSRCILSTTFCLFPTIEIISYQQFVVSTSCVNIKSQITVDVVNVPELFALYILHSSQRCNRCIVCVHCKGIGGTVFLQVFCPGLFHIGSSEIDL